MNTFKSVEEAEDEFADAEVEKKREQYEEVLEDNISPQLEAVFDFYNCADFLPFVRRIIWIGNVKEALGYVPDDFCLNYDEITALVILQTEVSRKSQKDLNESKERSEKFKSSSASQFKRTPRPNLRRRL